MSDEVTIIQQRMADDCVIASMAMFTNKSYEEVWNHAVGLGVEPKGKGINDDAESALGKSLGVFLVRMPYMGGAKGILSVPSLHDIEHRVSHAVYVNNYKIYDPQTNVKDKLFYDVAPGYFPTHINVAIDLNDEYSRDLFKGHHYNLRHDLDDYRKWVKGE